MTTTTLSPEAQQSRAQGIGGSEIAAVVGVSPWQSAIDVYLRKVGEAPDIEPSHHLERGVYLEPGIIQWYRSRTGHSVRRCHKPIIHRDASCVRATPDGLVYADGRGVMGGRGVLEVKSPGYFASLQWGDPSDGADGVPEVYLCQAAYEMAVTSRPWADVVSLIDDDLKIYRVERDRALEDALVSAAVDFWEQHVMPRVPPPPDGSESYDGYLRRRFTQPRGEVVDAPPLLDELAQKMRAAKEAADVADREYKRARQDLEAALGDLRGIKGGFGRIQRVERQGSPAWKRIAELAGATTDLIEANRSAPTTYVRATWSKDKQ